MKGTWSRIAVIFWKEIFVVLREPKMRALLLGPPIIQLVIFGYAVTLDVSQVSLGWMDRDKSPESRQLEALFDGSEYFRIVQRIETEEEFVDLLDRGSVRAVVRIPEDFSEDLLRQAVAKVLVVVDGTNSNTASIAANYIRQVVADFSSRKMEDRQRHLMIGATFATGSAVEVRVPRLQLESRVWFNPELKSQDYYVPGVVVNIIALVTVMLTALAIVREKEIGTMEQLMVTPIRSFELMFGKTLPFALIGIVDVILITVVSLLVFGIPFRGSPILLLGGAVVFLLTTLGAGLLISTLSNTQQQAMMGSFFFFLPVFMLSGFAFPIRNMPIAVQYVTYWNPVRYFLEITRGVFLKGIGIEILWPQVLAMLALGLGMITLSALRFRKRLD